MRVEVFLKYCLKKYFSPQGHTGAEKITSFFKNINALNTLFLFGFAFVLCKY
jgi:hypothetical protein